MPKITVVIPTYNEVNNLLAITKTLFNLGIDGLDILVVDDHSPDGTGILAEQLKEKYPGRFDVIHRQEKGGLGTAYIAGFTRALELGADLIVQMDADFSHSPAYIPQMIAESAAYDLVIGSRYVAGGRLDENWGWGRWFLSWWANSVWVRLILGLRTRDATAGFKCWRQSALEVIELNRIRSNGYVFQVEMCYVAERSGLAIKEIPIYFEDRRIGQSKMDMRVKIEAALRVFEIRRRYRHQVFDRVEKKATASPLSTSSSTAARGQTITRQK